MWAVVGLGNPGRRYAKTRHNAGFLLIQKVAKENGSRLKKRIYLSRTTICNIMGEEVLLAAPQTYMNNSGAAVKWIIDETGIKPEKLVLVYDDVDIPLGEIRIRKKGSAGTHKGGKSVIEHLQTDGFPRIRIGVGPIRSGIDATEFVLSPFRKGEELLLNTSLDMAQEALGSILRGQMDIAMNTYNQRIRHTRAD